MVVNSFWSEKFEQALSKYASGIKSVSEWKLLHLLILKYNLDLSPRGLSTTEVALRLMKNPDMWGKIDKKDKEFIEGLFK